MFDISQPFSHIVVSFVLDGEKYDVEHSNILFQQSTDYKGQPQNEVRGGQLSITLTQAANDTMYLWAKKSTMLKDVQLLFQTDMGITLLSIDLINAYCINLDREFSSRRGTSTNLTISSEEIVMNGITHNNKWKKTD